MKSLILVAVILQLVIIGTETDGKYQFGDIIEFPRKCGSKTMYSHFAIYVGPESGVNVGQGDNDIFQRVVREEKKDICEFGKLDETRRESIDKKNNYLEGQFIPDPTTNEDIIQRIRAMLESCGKYDVVTNNCEHLATYVRYGIPRSLQKGTLAGCFLFLANNAKEEEIKKKFEAVMNRSVDTIKETDENNNALCTNDAPKQGSWWSVLSACLALCCLLSGSSDF